MYKNSKYYSMEMFMLILSMLSMFFNNIRYSFSSILCSAFILKTLANVFLIKWN